MARILGDAIGKPGLKWNVISDERFQNQLTAAGFSLKSAKGLTGMNEGRRGGVLYEDYYRNKPTLKKIKLTHFAKEFATAFLKS